MPSVTSPAVQRRWASEAAHWLISFERDVLSRRLMDPKLRAYSGAVDLGLAHSSLRHVKRRASEMAPAKALPVVLLAVPVAVHVAVRVAVLGIVLVVLTGAGTAGRGGGRTSFSRLRGLVAAPSQRKTQDEDDDE